MKPTTTDDVLELMDAQFTASALDAALELGLFWRLEEMPLDTAGVAEAYGIPPRRCAYWLQLLIGAGLIDRVDERCVPSSTAREAILESLNRESWAMLAEEARRRSAGLRDLALHLGEPGSVWAASRRIHTWPTMPGSTGPSTERCRIRSSVSLPPSRCWR